MKLAYMNLGCPKNQVDLETILGGLEEQATLVEDAREADVMIINTCSFLESSKKESIDAIFDVVSARRDNPNLKIFVAGCLPQRYKEEVATLIPEVDQFFPTVDATKTLARMKDILQRQGNAKPTRKLLTPGHYAYLRVAEGCNNRCAYCAIPLIKGNFASRPMADILAEARGLAANGVKEIMVIAQDTTRYGADLREDISLRHVLQALDEIDGLEWIRLLYTHPAHWNDELIEVVASLDKVVHYFDVPIQHISDPILKRMGRRVSRGDIELLIEKLRARMPDVALRTSIIAGFPGETEEQFIELLDFLQETRFERLGVFTYSHEEGTRAYRLEDDVPEEVKLERQRMIMRQQDEIVQELNAAKVGSVVRVLVDEVDEEHSIAYARSQWDAPEVDGNIFLPASVLKGEFYTVRILDANIYDLYGQVV